MPGTNMQNLPSPYSGSSPPPTPHPRKGPVDVMRGTLEYVHGQEPMTHGLLPRPEAQLNNNNFVNTDSSIALKLFIIC